MTDEEKKADRRAAFKKWQSVPASHRVDDADLLARMKGMSREEFSALCVEFGIREGARNGCGA